MGDDHKRCKYNNEDVKLLMNSQSSTGIENGDMPEWLLVEVLLRLPSKFVFRFKLVSKEWLSIISDPVFVRAYVSRASLLSQKQPCTFICRNIHPKKPRCKPLCRADEYLLLKEVYSQQYSQVAESTYTELALPNWVQKQNAERGNQNYVIISTSNGLLLCGSLYGFCNLYICNPVTDQWIALPQLTRSRYYMFRVLGFTAHVEDGYLESYRVVRLEAAAYNENTLHFKVFISEIGEWKTFDVSTYVRVLPMVRVDAIAVDGVLHWILIHDDIDSIIVYDPYRSPQQVRLVAGPEKLNRHGNLFSEYKGKLRYLRLYYTFPQSRVPSIKVWVLNDDHHRGGGGGDWSLQHYISNVDILFDENLPFRVHDYIRLLNFHPFDSDILYLGYRTHLVSLNFETKKLEIQQKFGRRLDEPDILLMILPWPISINPSPSLVFHSSS